MTSSICAGIKTLSVLLKKTVNTGCFITGSWGECLDLGKGEQQVSEVNCTKWSEDIVSVHAMRYVGRLKCTYLQPFLSSALHKGGWSTSDPEDFTTGKEPRYPLYRTLSPAGIQTTDRPGSVYSIYLHFS